MAGVNKIILLGNLGQDPEVKTLEGGKTVAKFNIATSESYTNRSGERVESTEWHRLEMWDTLATLAQKHLKKGNTVYVEGKLKTEKWTDKDGVERESKKVQVTTMTFVGGSKNTESAATSETGQGATSVTAEQIANSEDDNLPF